MGREGFSECRQILTTQRSIAPSNRKTGVPTKRQLLGEAIRINAILDREFERAMLRDGA